MCTYTLSMYVSMLCFSLKPSPAPPVQDSGSAHHCGHGPRHLSPPPTELPGLSTTQDITPLASLSTRILYLII